VKFAGKNPGNYLKKYATRKKNASNYAKKYLMEILEFCHLVLPLLQLSNTPGAVNHLL
jgi:hypothetical protein